MWSNTLKKDVSVCLSICLALSRCLTFAKNTVDLVENFNSILCCHVLAFFCQGKGVKFGELYIGSIVLETNKRDRERERQGEKDKERKGKRKRENLCGGLECAERRKKNGAKVLARNGQKRFQGRFPLFFLLFLTVQGECGAKGNPTMYARLKQKERAREKGWERKGEKGRERERKGEGGRRTFDFVLDSTQLCADSPRAHLRPYREIRDMTPKEGKMMRQMKERERGRGRALGKDRERERRQRRVQEKKF